MCVYIFCSGYILNENVAHFAGGIKWKLISLREAFDWDSKDSSVQFLKCGKYR